MESVFKATQSLWTRNANLRLHLGTARRYSLIRTQGEETRDVGQILLELRSE
jgi:hypothetical protein